MPLLAAGYAALVVYGSLLPFEIRAVSLAAAWERFSNITYLTISAAGRADWTANILLFIPLALLWCAAATRGQTSRRTTVVQVFAACLALAIVLEFCQLWFAPRTVSQNDILAEWIGSAIGVLIWVLCGRGLLRSGAVIAAGGTAGLVAGLTLYAGAYILYAFMPFDFVISAAELESLIRRKGIMPFLSPQCGGVFRCGAKSLIEIASFVPIGFLLVLIAQNRRRSMPGPLMGATVGAIVALLIEAGQMLILSAVAQGLSVATRAVGMAAGVYLGRAWRPAMLTRWLRMVPPLLFCGGAGYLLLVAFVMWRGAWRLDGAVERLQAVNWLPFYYHYWTTEQAAIVSVVFNSMLYAPIGIGFWLVRFWEGGGHRTEFSGAGRAAATAVLVAVTVESARLLKATGHPDPTNILIAPVAAVLAFRVLGWGAACLLPAASTYSTFRRPSRQRTG